MWLKLNKQQKENWSKISLPNILGCIKGFLNDRRKICALPFSYCELHGVGDVYFCCPAWISTSIGNINENEFEDVWNGPKAKGLRNKMLLKGKTPFCNTKRCIPYKLSIGEIKSKYFDEVGNIKLPTIKICFDKECNLACITCRDKILKNSSEQELQMLKIKEKLKDVMLKANEVSFSGSGDPFASRFINNYMKEIAQTNKTVLFRIHTNGTLMTKERCKELGIYKRISQVQISLHSGNEEVYNKICKHGNFNKVLENIEWISKDDSIQERILTFVITHLNFREIPTFIELAEKYNFIPKFLNYNYWGTEFGKNISEVEVWKKSHPDNKEFKKIVKPYLKKYRNSFSKSILEMKD